MKKNSNPTYKMAYSELLQLADAAIFQLKRDLKDLASFGFTETDVNVIAEQAGFCKGLKSYEYYRGAISNKIEEKNAIRQRLINAIQGVSSRARMVFGVQSVKYKRYKMTDVLRAADNELYRISKNIHAAATDDLKELESKGLTKSILDELESIYKGLDSAIDAVRQIETESDMATQERVTAGNKLYALISGSYEIGKEVYQFSDESKYKQYVVYNTSFNINSIGEPLPEVS